MFINYFVEKKIRKMNIIRSNNHEIYLQSKQSSIIF